MTRQAQHSEMIRINGFVNMFQEKKETPAEKRHKRIAEAAYYIAEKHGFQGDTQLEDWLEAEAKEDSRFITMDWPDQR